MKNDEARPHGGENRHLSLPIRKRTVVITAVLCLFVDLLPVRLLPADARAPNSALLSTASAEEGTPSAPESQAAPATAPAATTGGPPTTAPAEATGSTPTASPAAVTRGTPTTTPAEATGGTPTSAPEAPGKPLSVIVDTVHGDLSRRLQNTASWLDSFFTDESYLKEINHSYMRLRYDVFKEEGTRATMKPAVDLRLALPELERKSHLIFSAEPAEPPLGSAAPAKTTGERFGTSEQQNVTTAVHYIFRSSTKESFLVRSGMQFSKCTPVLFGAPRYRALFPLDSWNMRFTQEVLYRTDSGWQTDTRLEFERLLSADFFFRTGIDGIWTARVEGYLFSLDFALRQTIDPTHALDYELINYYQTQPNGELTEVDFRIRYRHSFWRNWLFFEVAPQVRFPRDRKFIDTPGILFRLEMFIGETR